MPYAVPLASDATRYTLASQRRLSHCVSLGAPKYPCATCAITLRKEGLSPHFNPCVVRCLRAKAVIHDHVSLNNFTASYVAVPSPRSAMSLCRTAHFNVVGVWAALFRARHDSRVGEHIRLLTHALMDLSTYRRSWQSCALFYESAMLATNGCNRSSLFALLLNTLRSLSLPCRRLDIDTSLYRGR